MKKPKDNPDGNALQGLSSLTVDAITGVADLIESLHLTISSGAGLLGSKEKGKGLTGMVYRNIRSLTEAVGDRLDGPLKLLGKSLTEKEPSPAQEAVRSALNGVLGDHLEARDNPLAIHMQLRQAGKPINQAEIGELMHQQERDLLIMIHGSCMNDLQWQQKGHDHGAALAEELGWLPLYLHYNSGRHISHNGRELAEQLESLLQGLPPSRSLVFLGHSMGGLVSRSACYYAQAAGHSWLKQLKRLITLGTPHHGAPLEKGGNGIDLLLQVSPFSAPFARLGKIRSSGITDLRYGYIIDEDWAGRDRFDVPGDHRHAVPLPRNLACYAMAATRSKDASLLGDHLLGDGLVTVDSALGHHPNPEFQLDFPIGRQWLGRGMNHMDLLHEPEVYAQLKGWLWKEI